METTVSFSNYGVKKNTQKTTQYKKNTQIQTFNIISEIKNTKKSILLIYIISNLYKS